LSGNDTNQGFSLESFFAGLIDMIQSLFSTEDKVEDGSTLSESNKELTFQELMNRYPSPTALKCAVNRGELDYNLLRQDIKKIVDDAPLPPPSIVKLSC